MSFAKFLKSSWLKIKILFSCLVSVALFRLWLIILENIFDALGTKYSILRGHLIMQMNSENIDS